MKKFFKKNINYKQAGFSVVEVLVACIIMSVVTIAVMSAISKGINLSAQALNKVQASNLIEEGIEAVKTIRDNDWTTIANLSSETNYYLSYNLNLNIWTLGTVQVAPVDGYTRTIIFSDVRRDGNDDISSSGTIDPGIKKVKVIVSWSASGDPSSKEITFYLADIFN